MTEKELMEHLLVIYSSLEKLTVAVKLLLDESIEKERTIFDETDDVIEKFDRDCREFIEGVLKHGKNVE